MQKPLTNPSTISYESLKRNRIVRVLETVQDLFVISLCIALFASTGEECRVLRSRCGAGTEGDEAPLRKFAH